MTSTPDHDGHTIDHAARKFRIERDALERATQDRRDRMGRVLLRCHGYPFRIVMRVTHWLGFCWPERTPMGGYWCGWCGLRGSK